MFFFILPLIFNWKLSMKPLFANHQNDDALWASPRLRGYFQHAHSWWHQVSWQKFQMNFLAPCQIYLFRKRVKKMWFNYYRWLVLTTSSLSLCFTERLRFVPPNISRVFIIVLISRGSDSVTYMQCSVRKREKLITDWSIKLPESVGDAPFYLPPPQKKTMELGS